MTDIKTIFSTEVKQPKLGVICSESTALGFYSDKKEMPYFKALAKSVLSQRYTRNSIYWVEPVFEDHK
ncbi:MAG: hypothetical protein COB09_17020 [Thalassobium sp.]|nr:MAG: hypothetical protein COB09_17020 [Thalassobium sp.]